jgi:hypothetical protein
MGIDVLIGTTGISNVEEDTTPTLGGTLDANSNDIDNAKMITFIAEVDNGNSGATDTIDIGAGQKQKSTLTANCTYTFTAPDGPCNFVLKLIQGGIGSYTVTWPGTVKWAGGTAPTLSTGVGDIDIVSFYYDETSYYGQAALDFQ